MPYAPEPIDNRIKESGSDLHHRLADPENNPDSITIPVLLSHRLYPYDLIHVTIILQYDSVWEKVTSILALK
jgi:hypothetical protein